MKRILFLLSITLNAMYCYGQHGALIENKVIKISIQQETDTIDFIVVDTVLNERKPVFLWCQGSLPIPLFCEVENYGYYFLGGGVSNFNYKDIVKEYHLVIISMPKTPVLARKENLNNRFQYIPNSEKPNDFSDQYNKADYLENYVQRALVVLSYLKQQSWASKEKLVVAGHSQGTKVAAKLAIMNNDVTHLGLFAANPFGRIDQTIRESRLNAQLGKISWNKADSLMTETYEFYKHVNNEDSIRLNPGLKSLHSFSETFYDDWLNLDIPIYLAYGTEDRTSDLCDIIPLFFIEKNKNNLTLKRYPGLEHNFFEVHENGQTNHEKGHWAEVMDEFIEWLK